MGIINKASFTYILNSTHPLSNWSSYKPQACIKKSFDLPSIVTHLSSVDRRQKISTDLCL